MAGNINNLGVPTPEEHVEEVEVLTISSDSASERDEDDNNDFGSLMELFIQTSKTNHPNASAETEVQMQKLEAVLPELEQLVRDKTGLELLQNKIGAVQHSDKHSKVIVAVVGQTGAGKSSLINALLDFKGLLPTSGSRACTSIITEISLNTDPRYAYKAEFEFLSRTEWLEELSVLRQDLDDDEANIQQPDSPSSIAWAKVNAVYPSLDAEGFHRMNEDEILAYGDITVKLGMQQVITARDPKTFSKGIRPYIFPPTELDNTVDSATKTSVYWPVLKRGRIFLRAKVLETGATLVDLPGVHDSNVARRSIATNYLTQSSVVCIVSNSKRCVNEQSATGLLGETLKRHLHFDGSFDRVVWVNSHSDDFDPEEVAKDHDNQMLREQVAELKALKEQKNVVQIESKNQQVQLANLRKTRNLAKRTRTAYQKLEKRLMAGDVVYDPRVKSTNKRKRDDHDRVKLDLDSIRAIIDDESKKADTSDTDIGTLQKNMRQTVRQIRNIEDGECIEVPRCWRTALQVRNDSLIRQMKAKYMAVVVELDEDARRMAEELHFRSTDHIRDYAALAESFKVFSTSSRGYQHVKDRLDFHRKDMYFHTEDQTGIPSLRSYLIEIARATQDKGCTRRRDIMLSAVVSLHLWAARSEHDKTLSDDDVQGEIQHLISDIERLEKTLIETCTLAVTKVSDDIQNYIYHEFKAAIKDAKTKASDVQKNWGERVDRANPSNGGLYFGEYKATVRRNGEYSNRRNEFNFHWDLWNPFLDAIAHVWDYILRNKLDSHINTQITEGEKCVQLFYNRFQDHALRTYTDPITLRLLQDQMRIWQDFIHETLNSAKDTLLAGKKIAYREPVEEIRAAMNPVYGPLSEIKGKGSFLQMRNGMEQHVTKAKGRMYDNAAKVFKTKLDRSQQRAIRGIQKNIPNLVKSMHEDCKNILVKGAEGLSETDAELRDEVLRIIKENQLLEVLERAEHEDNQSVIKFESNV